MIFYPPLPEASEIQTQQDQKDDKNYRTGKREHRFE